MAQVLPLSGLRVVEYGHWVSAPYCGKLLADMGAEVIKIEDVPGGDPARWQPPFIDNVPHPEKSGLFLYLNLGKRSVTLSLATAAGRKLFRQLVAEADVLIEDRQPGELDKIGLGAATLRADQRELIVVSITPFGQTGPYRDFRATDLVLWHLGGFGYGFPGVVDDLNESPPLNAPGRASFILAGTTAAAATMHALLRRRVAGEGGHVDVSELESVTGILFGEIGRGQSGETRQRQRVRGQRPLPPIAVIPCKNGYVAISPREDHQWARWLDVLGHPDWAADERFGSRISREEHWDELWERVSEWTKTRTKQEVFEAAQVNRVPCFPVNTMLDVLESPQFAAREFFAEVDHDIAGRLRYPMRPYWFSGAPLPPPNPAPLLGQHNQEVYSSLGYKPADLVKLRAGGAI